MTPLRSRSNAWTSLGALGLLSALLANACSAKDEGVVSGPNTASGAGGGSAVNGGQGGGSSGAPVTSQGGTTPGGSSPVTQGGTNMGGVTSQGGASGGGTTTAGAGGISPSAGTGTGTGGFEPGDTPPPHPLNVTAAVGEHQHGDAGLDTRAKSLGKLVVDIGVNSGGYSSFLAKRGYHSIGAPCGSCPAPGLDAGRDAVGTCRLGEFANTEASVKAKLASLQQQYPEEDWGYFLNADKSVRWSDVAITGMSHGATTAAVAGRLAARMWRVVSRSGPRDNNCGNNGGVCTMPLTTPSFDTNCPPAKVASWLDQPSKTPMERFYGIVGTTDVECGDIMFNMSYAKYPGAPVLFNMAGAVLTGTNQFFTTEGGHLDFLSAANKPLNTEEVLNIAFGIPSENQHPAF